MIVHGFPKLDLAIDLEIARRIGAEVLEILPYWPVFPDPESLRVEVEDAGFRIHSAHGSWGGHSIRAGRVDLASPNSEIGTSSLDDLKLCADWLGRAGGSCLVIHPGGLSDRADQEIRRDALFRGLALLADHVQGTGVTVCVENMPTGVFPGSRMAEIAAIVTDLNRPEIGLALDTGHANITSTAANETLSAGSHLRTTHVHDNDGRQDRHLPPGRGTIDWGNWIEALDAIDYRGPIVLECIKFLRDQPDCMTPDFLCLLRLMTGLDR